jgi:hypothetical protein
MLVIDGVSLLDLLDVDRLRSELRSRDGVTGHQ